MGVQSVTSVERLARQICKLLSVGNDASLAEIRAYILSPARKRYDVSSKWRYQQQLKEGNFEKAIELGVSSGWLLHRDGMISLTEAGSRVGRRSRVGKRRVRSTF